MDNENYVKSISLPFNFTYYGIKYNTVNVHGNGKIFFGVQNSDLIKTYPTAENQLDISICWNYLEPTNNIYFWNDSKTFVIEYHDIYYYNAEKAGTFEIVLFDNGTIKYQYQHLDTLNTTVIGLNYGINTSYFTSFENKDELKNNFSVIFTAEEIIYHNLAVDMKNLSNVLINENNSLNVTIYNLGTVAELDIIFELLEDGIVKDGGTISLESGEDRTILLDWSATELKIINLTLMLIPVIGEFFTNDNKKTSFVEVDGIAIVSPRNGKLIEGGLVEIYLDYTQEDLFKEMIIYLNDEQLFNITEDQNNRIVIPVFRNGTNTIKSELYWSNGNSACTDVTINSINITKSIIIREFDYITWEIIQKDTNNISLITYKFGEWVTGFKMNVTKITQNYMNELMTSEITENLVIDILNGHIYQNFNENLIYIVQNAMSDDSTNHDYIIYKWNKILQFKEELEVNGYNALAYNGNFKNEEILAYIHKQTGVLIRLETGNTIESLKESNIVPPPELISPIIVTRWVEEEMQEREGGKEIAWLVNDRHPGIYTVYRNGSKIESGIWTNQTRISIEIDTNTVGLFNYTIKIEDAYHNYIIDTVFITVFNTPDPPTIEIIYPNGGENLSGKIIIQWQAYDRDGDQLNYSVLYWNNLKWIELVSEYNETVLSWDVSSIKNGQFYKIKVTASDGVFLTFDESNVFNISNTERRVSSNSYISIILFLMACVLIRKRRRLLNCSL